jgi:uncharacterized membrane protein
MTNNQQTAQESVQERSTAFKPVEGGTETTSAATFLVAAYVLMWLCVLVFILLTWRKTRSAQAQVDRLEKALAKLPEAG